MPRRSRSAIGEGFALGNSETVGSLFARVAAQSPHKTFLIHPKGSITYGEGIKRVAATAAHLECLGPRVRREEPPRPDVRRYVRHSAHLRVHRSAQARSAPSQWLSALRKVRRRRAHG